MPLISHLADDFVVPGGFLKRANLPDVVGEWLLHKDVLAAFHGGHGGGKVRVIWCGYGHGVDVVCHLVEHHTKVFEAWHVRILAESLSSALVIDVANRRKVFSSCFAHGIIAHPSGANDRNVDFGGLTWLCDRKSRKCKSTSCGTGSLQEFAAIDCHHSQPVADDERRRQV